MNRSNRIASLRRATQETSIEVEVNLDGCGRANVKTGIGFLDHMLNSLAKHSRVDLVLQCEGDLQVDTHHTTEDCALALGETIRKALVDFSGIQRFGSAYAPLDEALSRVVIDLCGRPFPAIDIPFRREQIGTVATEDIVHFFGSFAMGLGATLHVEILRGENDHHKAEAAFKALALALREAIRNTGFGDVPSTKGVLG